MTDLSVPFFAKALFDYEAVESTELSVAKGDFLTVEEVNESGWCLAKLMEKSGWLPTDYIERIRDDAEEQSNGDRVVEQAQRPQPTQVAQPIYGGADPMFDLPKPSGNISREDEKRITDTLSSMTLATKGATPQRSDGNTKVCSYCSNEIHSAFVVAGTKTFHTDHFMCATCKCNLGGKAYIEKDNHFYCENDYYEAFNPKCGSCHQAIKGQYISAMDKAWHPECFVCAECRQPFKGTQFRKHGGKPYCEEHFGKLFADKCTKCGLNIDGPVFEALDQKYHLDCFVCSFNGHKIGEGVGFHAHEGKIYCPQHFEEMFLEKCHGCGQLIKAQYIKVMDSMFHPECWKCTDCKQIIRSDNCAQDSGKFYCKPCLTKRRETNPSSYAASSNGPSSNGSTPGNEKAHAALAKIQANQEAKAAAEQQKLSTARGGYAPIGSKIYDYATLRDNVPADVDPAKREQYLDDAEFARIFGIEKPPFYQQPTWKQNEAKKKHGLF